MRPAERRARVFLACLLLALPLGGCDAAQPTSDAELLAQTHGEWLLINYWAAWCKPCIEEIPELNAFAVMHEPRVRVLMVNFDGATGDELREQAQRLGITTGLLEHDPGPRFGFERPQSLPATFVIAPDGSLHGTLFGRQTIASLGAAIGLH